MPAGTLSWLWRRPARAATLAYALGTLASSSALGVAAMAAEGHGYSASDIFRFPFFAWFTALSILASVLWGGTVVRLALALPTFDTALVVFGAIAMTVVTLFEALVMVAGGRHGESRFLASTVGLVLALFLDAVRIASFIGVAELVKRERDGDADCTPLDVSAAACAWTAAVALIGLLIGPGLVFQAPAAVVLVFALSGLLRVHTLLRAAAIAEGDDAVHARGRVRAALLTRGGTGALLVCIVGAALVPYRLYEQITRTRNPALIAIFKADAAHPWEVIPAGREGDVSLWLVDCGNQKMGCPTIGWDERQQVLLQHEKLFERVPRLRTGPANSPAPAAPPGPTPPPSSDPRLAP